GRRAERRPARLPRIERGRGAHRRGHRHPRRRLPHHRRAEGRLRPRPGDRLPAGGVRDHRHLRGHGLPRHATGVRDPVRRLRPPGLRPDRRPGLPPALPHRRTGEDAADHPDPLRRRHRRRRAPLGEPRGLLRPHPRAARGDRRRPAGRLLHDARRDRVRRPGDDARAEAPLLVQGRGRPLRHRRPLLRAGAARGEGRDPRRLRSAGGHRARGGGRRGGRRHRPRGDRPALPVPAGPGDGRGERAPHRPAGRHPRGARHRLARLRGDHLRDRGLLRPPRGRPRTGDRLRHALPARRAGGPLPARHRPDPGRRGPHAGPAQLEGGRVMTDFMLPDLGEGLTEATIVAWHVAVGDVVTRNQPIAEVETAKALVELPSPRAGRITALHAAEGETLAVGAPLIALETEAPGGADGGGPAAGSGADDAGSEADDSAAVAAGSGPTAPSPATSDTAASSAPAAGTEQPAPQRQQVLVGYGPMLPGTGRPRRRPRSFETVPYVGRGAEEAAGTHPEAIPRARRPARALAASRPTPTWAASRSRPPAPHRRRCRRCAGTPVTWAWTSRPWRGAAPGAGSSAATSTRARTADGRTRAVPMAGGPPPGGPSRACAARPPGRCRPPRPPPRTPRSTPPSTSPTPSRVCAAPTGTGTGRPSSPPCAGPSCRPPPGPRRPTRASTPMPARSSCSSRSPWVSPSPPSAAWWSRPCPGRTP